MNLVHRWYCRSDGWRQAVHSGMMPGVLGKLDLGGNVLEIGPGPGITTDWLRERVPQLTCIEIDSKLADSLKSRLADTNTTVVEGDATAMPFPNDSFDMAVCFTMLHHVPSRELQDRLLAETRRVLKPGAAFTGCDSTPTLRWRLFHLFDTCVPVEPEMFSARLEQEGFTDVRVNARPQYNSFQFFARKPVQDA